jgi:hypothetical protein
MKTGSDPAGRSPRARSATASACGDHLRFRGCTRGLHLGPRPGRQPGGPGNYRWHQGVVDGNLVVAATPRGAVYNSTGG